MTIRDARAPARRACGARLRCLSGVAQSGSAPVWGLWSWVQIPPPRPNSTHKTGSKGGVCLRIGGTWGNEREPFRITTDVYGNEHAELIDKFRRLRRLLPGSIAVHPGRASSMSSPLPPRPGDAPPRCRCSPVGPAREPVPVGRRRPLGAGRRRRRGGTGSSSSWPPQPASVRRGRRHSAGSHRRGREGPPAARRPSRRPCIPVRLAARRGCTAGDDYRRPRPACDRQHTRPSRSRSRLPSGRIAQAVGLA